MEKQFANFVATRYQIRRELNLPKIHSFCLLSFVLNLFFPIVDKLLKWKNIQALHLMNARYRAKFWYLVIFSSATEHCFHIITRISNLKQTFLVFKPISFSFFLACKKKVLIEILAIVDGGIKRH